MGPLLTGETSKEEVVSKTGIPSLKANNYRGMVTV
jgi:hypothetical protein